jgi:AcrR family transcriptional regulator
MGTVPDRVEDRPRAVQLARHYREAEGLSIAQIAQRLGRSPATVKAYFYDPTGEKAKAVKARYQGICRGCGAPTPPRNGKGDAYAHCTNCHPGASAPKWTRERVRDAIRARRDRYGEPPSSYDWSRTHARRRGGQALARLAEGDWPAPPPSPTPTGRGPPHAPMRPSREVSAGIEAADRSPCHPSRRCPLSLSGTAAPGFACAGRCPAGARLPATRDGRPGRARG